MYSVAIVVTAVLDKLGTSVVLGQPGQKVVLEVLLAAQLERKLGSLAVRETQLKQPVFWLCPA